MLAFLGTWIGKINNVGPDMGVGLVKEDGQRLSSVLLRHWNRGTWEGNIIWAVLFELRRTFV